MTFGFSSIQDGITSHAMQLGIFDVVNTHEPKNKPGNGLTASIWVENIEPTRSSGLSSTSARIMFNVRIAMNMMHEPQDEIDTIVTDAVDFLFAAYSSDFDLGATVRCIDLLGQLAGNPLSAEFGYMNQDSTVFRVAVISLPVIVNDVWEQSA